MPISCPSPGLEIKLHEIKLLCQTPFKLIRSSLHGEFDRFRFFSFRTFDLSGILAHGGWFSFPTKRAVSGDIEVLGLPLVYGLGISHLSRGSFDSMRTADPMMSEGFMFLLLISLHKLRLIDADTGEILASTPVTAQKVLRAEGFLEPSGEGFTKGEAEEIKEKSRRVFRSSLNIFMKVSSEQRQVSGLCLWSATRIRVVKS